MTARAFPETPPPPNPRPSRGRTLGSFTPLDSGTRAAGWRAQARPRSRRYGRRPRAACPRRSPRRRARRATCSATQATSSQSALSQHREPRAADLHLVAAEQDRIGADHGRDRSAGADHRHRPRADPSHIARRPRHRRRADRGSPSQRPQHRFHRPSAEHQDQEVEGEMDRAGVEEGRGQRSQPERRHRLVAAISEPGRNEAAARSPPIRPASARTGRSQTAAVTMRDRQRHAGVFPAVGHAHRGRPQLGLKRTRSS